MEIKTIGKFHQIDENGFIQNCCILPIVQEEYNIVISDIISALNNNLKELIHSIYIRGSVAKGIAIHHISDIDTIIIANRKLSATEQATKRTIYDTIATKYPFVNGIELHFIDYADCNNKRIQFLLKTQCACIYGTDINNTFNYFKLDKNALSPAETFLQEIIDTRQELLNETDPNEIKDICTWIMKRIIRTGYETVMFKDQSYTRDLYLNFIVFCKYHPEKSNEMQQALTLAIEPVSEKEKIISVIDSLADFINENVQKMLSSL